MRTMTMIPAASLCTVKDACSRMISDITATLQPKITVWSTRAPRAAQVVHARVKVDRAPSIRRRHWHCTRHPVLKDAARWALFTSGVLPYRLEKSRTVFARQLRTRSRCPRKGSRDESSYEQLQLAACGERGMPNAAMLTIATASRTAACPPASASPRRARSLRHLDRRATWRHTRDQHAIRMMASFL